MTEPRKPLLLGESPSKTGDRYHAFPLSGRPAKVLCELAGIPPVPNGSTYGRWTWALYEEFECRNVFERYGEATPWRAPAAREAIREMKDDLLLRVVVCLGRRVQAAVYGALFPLLEIPPFYVHSPGPMASAVVVTIPHPSGLNRVLNDAAAREQTGEAIRRAISAQELVERQRAGLDGVGGPFDPLVRSAT